jgi:hypothetical protein
MHLSKQQQATKQQQSPADLIAACEADIGRLEQEREAHVARGVILAERRKAASYAAHVQHDPESRKELDTINAEIGTRASELQSFDDALATARAKWDEAQRAQAREAERARILEQRKLNEEYRRLALWLDRAADDWIAGARGALNNARGLAHPASAERVLIALMHCLMVKVRGTPALERELGVSDSNDARSFPSYQHVFDGWCNSNERDFKYRLAALDGEQTNKTEAA